MVYENYENMVRVSRDNPCPICNKPDWCLVAEDGSAAICPRVESDKQIGQAGWLHKLASTSTWAPRTRRMALRQALPSPEAAILVRQYQALAQEANKLDELANRLGLRVSSLHRFGVGRSPQGWWSWPMNDAEGHIVGINRRFADGQKKVMPGHRAGLYMPDNLPTDLSESTLLICEGATDAVAGLDLGFWTVGRFSCTHGARLLIRLIRARHPGVVVIVADSDGPGRRGGERLARTLLPYAPTLKVISPLKPHPDLRAWKQAGAKHKDLKKLIETTPARKLTIKLGR
ncbi:MAG: toprim domain-containing protein [Phycisphaerae bacterium]|nr:toprim domain-containing protein [Phycisphaerae bacterium]